AVGVDDLAQVPPKDAVARADRGRLRRAGGDALGRASPVVALGAVLRGDDPVVALRPIAMPDDALEALLSPPPEALAARPTIREFGAVDRRGERGPVEQVGLALLLHVVARHAEARIDRDRRDGQVPTHADPAVARAARVGERELRRHPATAGR